MKRYVTKGLLLLGCLPWTVSALCAKTPQEALDSSLQQQELRNPQSLPRKIENINNLIDKALERGSINDVNYYLQKALELMRDANKKGKTVPLAFRKRIQKCKKFLAENEANLQELRATLEEISSQLMLK